MNVSPYSASSRARLGAFTLIELLTVIAIIGILAAIIIPVTGKVRERARTTQCLSNVRQIAMGNVLFANDNKGVFLVQLTAQQNGQFIAPQWARNEGNWHRALARYMGLDKNSMRSRFSCPSAIMTDAQAADTSNTSYSVSAWLATSPGYGRVTAFTQPVVMVADTYVGNYDGTYPWNTRVGSYWAKRFETFRHNDNNRRNVGMTDGSARSLSPIQDGVFKDGAAFLPNLWLLPGKTLGATLNPSVPTNSIPKD